MKTNKKVSPVDGGKSSLLPHPHHLPGLCDLVKMQEDPHVCLPAYLPTYYYYYYYYYVLLHTTTVYSTIPELVNR